MRPFALTPGLAAAFMTVTLAAAQAQPAADAGNVPLAVTLKLRAADALERLIGAQSDPRSPQYAHFLSPAQFRAAYAPTAATYASTLAALRRDGFRIDRTWDNRTLVNVSAPPATVSRTFGAALARVNAGQQMHDVPLTPLLIPRDLPAVNAVIAAGSAPVTLNASVAHPALPAPAAASLSPAIGPDGGFSPRVFAAANDFPVMHGFDGAGVKVADIIDDADSDPYVDTFLENFGITRRIASTTVIGGATERDPEQPNIDAEWTLGVAPGVDYYIYDTGQFFNADLVGLFTQVVSDNVVDVVNSSFSVCELNDLVVLALQPILAQGAAQGIAFEGVQFGAPTTCSVSGPVDPIEYPGGDPNSLAVSASNVILAANGTIAAQSGSPVAGGGVSLIVPVPAFQASVPGVNPAGRNTPDLVIPGSINSAGPSAYFSESDPFGGPPSPPGWYGGFPFANNAPAAGLLAEIQQMVHHRLGAVDKTLYAIFASRGYGTVFSDITSGCDGVAGAKLLCAHTGYDTTSGIGSIDAYQLGLLFH